MIETIKNIESWIKDYVINQAHSNGVIIGMSGGKDSLVTAKLCANVLGKENVLGIIMPNDKMQDLEIAINSCEEIGIKYHIINIKETYDNILNSISPIFTSHDKPISSVTTINLPPRIRTNYLYAIAGSLNYLVANTSNLSEAMVGYTTKWGDNIGDFAPLATFTKTEVCKIGELLNLPTELVYKTPDDGLSGISDEEKLGFSYDELDNYIRLGIKSTNFQKIEKLNKLSNHKRLGVVKFDSQLKNHFE